LGQQVNNGRVQLDEDVEAVDEEDFWRVFVAAQVCVQLFVSETNILVQRLV
jgi:hypothetical protein